MYLACPPTPSLDHCCTYHTYPHYLLHLAAATSGCWLRFAVSFQLPCWHCMWEVWREKVNREAGRESYRFWGKSPPTCTLPPVPLWSCQPCTLMHPLQFSLHLSCTFLLPSHLEEAATCLLAGLGFVTSSWLSRWLVGSCQRVLEIIITWPQMTVAMWQHQSCYNFATFQSNRSNGSQIGRIL